MPEQIIENRRFDEERALYHLEDAVVSHCTFAGPADGESAMKESHRISLRHSALSLRYPLWHTTDFSVEDCTMDEGVRAPLWYSSRGKILNTVIRGVKCLRECEQILLSGDTVVSPEFGWKCRGLTVSDTDLTSEYAFLELSDAVFDRLTFRGKYAFQYTENVVIRDSALDTKDAFWHARNVRVENCRVDGEYLGWYSDGLTLVNCRISGTQPLCYCRNLTLIDCTMVGTDLAFEYSDVTATVTGPILSVKNPHSGSITADGFGAVILDGSVMENACRILDRTETLP